MNSQILNIANRGTNQSKYMFDRVFKMSIIKTMIQMPVIVVHIEHVEMTLLTEFTFRHRYRCIVGIEYFSKMSNINR